MKGKYNIMYLKNTLIDLLGFDNAYKPFMLLYLSGSKLQTRVCGGWYIHPGILSPLKSRYITPWCVGEGGYTLVDSFRPQSYSERKVYKYFVT